MKHSASPTARDLYGLARCCLICMAAKRQKIPHTPNSQATMAESRSVRIRQPLIVPRFESATPRIYWVSKLAPATMPPAHSQSHLTIGTQSYAQMTFFPTRPKCFAAESRCRSFEYTSRNPDSAAVARWTASAARRNTLAGSFS